MELFIFIAFQLLMEVQSYKSPTLKVSPIYVRSESSSLKMICETPAGVAVNQCFFYINSEENKKVNRSCALDLTGADVLRWAAVKSPASVKITCFYERSDNKTSSHSPAATLTVQAITVRSTSETTTYSETAVPHSDHIHSEVSWLSVVLVFTGVGLFLSGLMGFICLFNSSDDLLTEVNYSSCQVETTSLLTSSVCSKKHG
ncbi:uncharacterized protein [Chanodichthys erythropterus]|uniref:uncharacterized protein isoform X2 n=1 Tax=Chanodichthys erythropterus TaxID=933992 RepID=UPI00351F2460